MRTESNGHVTVRIVNVGCRTSAARKEGIRKATTGRIGLIPRPAVGRGQRFADRSAVGGVAGIGSRVLTVWAHVESETVAWNATAGFYAQPRRPPEK